jgi:SAM-dependent methyltransferase
MAQGASVERVKQGTEQRLLPLARHAGWLVERGLDRFFERAYGVRTADHISLKDLGVDGEHRVWHHPCDWIALWRALRRQRPQPQDVFVDFGSGLGRALLIAGRFPFGRVIGVELSDRLAEQARRNVARSSGRMRAGSVEVVTADALEWDIPGEMSFAFLYSPFTDELFARVFERILASLEQRPRLLRMIYDYPVEHNQVIGSGRALPIDTAPRSFPPRLHQPDDVMITYLLLPPGGAEAIPGDVPRPSWRSRRHPEWNGPYDPGFVLQEPRSATRVDAPGSVRTEAQTFDGE